MEDICSNDSPRKPDRKTIERNRRIRMKGLISELTTLVPPQHFEPSKEMLTQQDQIDQVATYITQLKETVEKLNKRKELLIRELQRKGTNPRNSAHSSSRIPVVKIWESGSSLEIVFVTDLRKNFALHEVIVVLEDQGLEVVNVSISTINGTIYHILHAQVKVPRLGADTLTIYGRLQKLFN